MVAVLLLFFAQAASAPPTTLARIQEDLAAGRFRDAIPLCFELLKASPHQPRLLMRLGMLQAMADDFAGAQHSLATAARLDPRVRDTDVFQGLSRRIQGDSAGAIDPLKKALDSQPDDLELRQVLADALYDAGHFEVAAANLIKVTDARPLNTRAWYVLGRAWIALARGASGQLLATAPADSEYALAAQGDTLMRLGQYTSAFAMYRSALEKDSNLVPARIALAAIYRKTEHPDWAGKEEALAAGLDCGAHELECQARDGRAEAVLLAMRNQQSPVALYWRAQAYEDLGSRAFEKLAQLPPSLELYRHRAAVAYEAGNRTGMVAELRQALRFAPTDRGLRRDLAMALGGLGDFGAAGKLARELLRDEPDSPELNALAGEALLKDQKPGEAIPFLKKALAANPKNAFAEASLGRALMQTGAVNLALPHLEAAASTDDDGSLHYELAHALRQSGQRDGAEQAMAKYRELSRPKTPPPSPPITPPE